MGQKESCLLQWWKDQLQWEMGGFDQKTSETKKETREGGRQLDIFVVYKDEERPITY